MINLQAGIALYDLPVNNVVTAEGYDLEEGIFPALAKELSAVISVIIRVYIVRGHKLHCKER